MAITCVECARGYQQIEVGVYLVEMFSDPPKPYKIWSADLWQCPNCGNKVVSGRGHGPLKEHYQPGFEDYLKKLDGADYCTVIYEYENSR